MHVIIDGNNLLHAMHAHAPVPAIGRETLVKVIERWAGQGEDRVTLVFDGPVPRGGLSKQMSSGRIAVRFSGTQTADDIIVEMIHQVRDPASVRVVTGDTAIRHETRLKRCRHTAVVSFVRELFPPPDRKGSKELPRGRPSEKPGQISAVETEEWLETFGLEEGDSLDEPDPMTS